MPDLSNQNDAAWLLHEPHIEQYAVHALQQ
jgi:hypothetical protein